MKGIKSKRLRVFIAKYIRYLEIVAYLFVLSVGGGVITAWCYKIDVTAKAPAAELKPYEHKLTAEVDCVVVRLPVTDKADVREGSLIAEICTAPTWLKLHQEMEKLKGAADLLEELEEAGAAPPEDQALLKTIQARLTAWEQAPAPEDVTQLRAPADGMLWLDGCERGRFVAAEKTICSVKDFSLLRAKFNAESGDVKGCKTGLKAKVEFVPELSDETLLRQDVPAGFIFGSSRHLISLHGATRPRELVETALVNQTFQGKEDVPLTVTKVELIDLMVSTKPVYGKTGGPELRPMQFMLGKHPGLVISGKHTGELTITELDGAIQERARGIVLDVVRSRTIAAAPEPYTVERFKSFVINAKLKGEKADPDWDWEARPEGRELIEGRGDAKGPKNVKFEKRKYPCTVQLTDPAPEVQDYMKRMALAGRSPKVTVEIVTDKRRFAMILFRKH